jgi:hypothetical protein
VLSIFRLSSLSRQMTTIIWLEMPTSRRSRQGGHWRQAQQEKRKPSGSGNGFWLLEWLASCRMV